MHFDLSWLGHQTGILIFLFVIGGIAFTNLLWFRSIRRWTVPRDLPSLAVLIPARNEERNIASCLDSLTAQEYPNLDIYVLDDQSSDRTAEIVKYYCDSNEKIHLIEGQTLPEGWFGKQWACQQLADTSQGDVLVFVDADVRLLPGQLKQAVAGFLGTHADLLSVIPRQEIGSWGEKFTVPFFMWSILLFLPHGLAYRLKIPAFSLTLGQFMLIRREVYNQINGHASVRQHAVDDQAIGQQIILKGYRWRLADGTSSLACRMYHGLDEAVEGFSKNIFPTFGYNIPVSLLIWIWLLVAFVEPVLLLILFAFQIAPADASLSLALAAVGISLLLFLLVSWRMRFPIYLAFFYPIIVLFYVGLGIRSLILTMLGRATWKGRRLVRS